MGEREGEGEEEEEGGDREVGRGSREARRECHLFLALRGVGMGKRGMLLAATAPPVQRRRGIFARKAQNDAEREGGGFGAGWCGRASM